MTGFFIKTANSTSGPYTGVEVREAALAGIIFADTGLGATTAGPWTDATTAGLFSENKIAINHPKGTHVPLFQVKGMPGAFQGPFKLRELIGFAARGMLPPDTPIQSDVSSDWVPAQKIQILNACFTRQLFLPGVEPVAVAPVAKVSVVEPTATTRADNSPLRVGLRSEQTSDDAEFVESLLTEPEPPPRVAEMEKRETHPLLKRRNEEEENAEADDPTLPQNIRLKLRTPVSWPSFSLKLLAIPVALLAIVSVGFVWTQFGMSRSQVIGDWVYPVGTESGTAFGISFKENGQCVVFNSRGESWTGDFEWVERTKRKIGFRNMASISAVVAEVGSGHQRDPVESGDGYIELAGFASQPPLVGDRRFDRFYVRQDNDNIRIGYVAAVHLGGSSRTMDAGWIEVVPAPVRPDIAADLKAIPREPAPQPTDPKAETARHISTAILSKDAERAAHGVATYSKTVDSAYLLTKYGVPDEARPILTFEVPRVEWDPRNEPYPFLGFQTVRYGRIKFVLTPAGELRFLALDS